MNLSRWHNKVCVMAIFLLVCLLEKSVCSRAKESVTFRQRAAAAVKERREKERNDSMFCADARFLSLSVCV